MGKKIIKSVGFEISMNMSISDEMIMYFGNWPKKLIFYQFSM